MRKHIPYDICERIYDILIKHAGAPEQYRVSFMHNYSNPESQNKPTEFRVCSRWGMAGKFWWANDKFYVSGRSMVECADKRDYDMENMEVDLVNQILAPLYEEFITRRDWCLPIPPHVRLEDVPKLNQYQGSLYWQLQMLTQVANRLGLQDAADFIQRSIDREKD